jgi:hypothetical protein
LRSPPRHRPFEPFQRLDQQLDQRRASGQSISVTFRQEESTSA